MGATEVFRLAGTIALDGTDHVQQELNNVANTGEHTESRLTTAFKKIGAAVATYFSITQVIQFGQSCIDLASDLAEVQNVVDVVFGDNASKVEEFSQTAQTQFGLSELAVKRYIGTMGAMLSSMGLAEDQTYEMSESLVGLAGDMASFYNLDSQEAFDKLRAGISGETEPLKQLGINLSEANLSAFALSQGIEASYSEMSEAEKVTLRYNYILSVTANAQGDFARTSDGYANQQRLMQLQIENLQKTLGQMLLPIMLEVTKAIIAVVEWIQQCITWVQENKDVIGLFVAILAGATAGLVAYKVAMVALKIMSTVTSLTDLLSKAFAFLNAVMLANPIMLIVTLIGALIGAFLYLYATNEGFRDFINNIFGEIGEVVGTVVNAIVEFFTVTIPSAINDVVIWFNQLGQSISDVFNSMVEWFASIPTMVSEFVQSVIKFFNELPEKIGFAIGQVLGHIYLLGKKLVSFVTTDIPNFIKSALDFFAQLPQRIGEYLTDAINKISEWATSSVKTGAEGASNFFNGIVEWIQQLPNKIGGFLDASIRNVATFASNLASKALEGAKNFFSNIVNTLKSLPSQMIEIGKNIINGIWQGISNAFGGLMDGIRGFGNSIVNGFKSALGIASPSKVMRDLVGKYIPEGIAVGITANADSVKDATSKLNEDMIASLQGTLGDVNSIVDMGNVTPIVEDKSTGAFASIETRFNQLYMLVANYLPQLANKDMQLVLDTGTLVGSIAPQMDSSLGDIYSAKGRGQ